MAVVIRCGLLSPTALNLYDALEPKHTGASPTMLVEGKLLWRPDEARIARANITAFMGWLAEERGLPFDSYDALWRWSVAELPGFWHAIWDYYRIHSPAPFSAVLADASMPGARWFPGARVNFAAHILREGRPAATALHGLDETGAHRVLTWAELSERVCGLATRMRELGVAPGDRVAAYLPNVPETVVAMLACASIGAVWSGCSPDFGTRSVLERLQQIEPKWLLFCDGYRYGGKVFDRRPQAQEIGAGLASLEQTVFVPVLEPGAAPPVEGALAFGELAAGGAAEGFAFEDVAFDHPLWILFSSGTTGPPKAIVHGHGGITLEMYKNVRLHCDIGPESTMFFHTTSGWVMWNLLVTGLAGGGAIVLYEGNPMHPGPEALWRVAERTGTTSFGASPTYVQLMQRSGIVPRQQFDLDALEHVLMSGSPATPETMAWFYETVGEDLWVAPTSGGTDVATGFVGGVPTLPVLAGRMQARNLGVDACALDEHGRELVGEVGELVIRQPMPSMPLYFWNDSDGSRYRESYFNDYPGMWRHGDFFLLEADGSCHIPGRSDATLNRLGVRIGTAEIYRCVEAIEGVRDSLVVNLDLPGGRFYMPLFLQLAEGAALDEPLRQQVRSRLRSECSPRHVPDAIIAVPEVPYTLTGKKMEVPVRRILTGAEAHRVASRDAMRNPAALDFFIDFAQRIGDH